MVMVLPVDDIKEHDEDSTTCECEPKIIWESGEMILVHNAFDGRHLEEQIQEILEDE
jgi:hypothetical protein